MLVDVTTAKRAMLFPFLELILITGVAWMGIGWLDAHGYPRNAVVIGWGLLCLWRFVLPLISQRRRRFTVYPDHIVAKANGKRDVIPMTDITGVRRRRGGITLAVRGYDLYFPDLPAPRKIERIIAEQLH